ncbi:putative Ras-GTPase-activating protein-binding protein [Tripterygium wilfordii]|uniref:Putative Ras-GTPase-activating protein-binding protein n=1 Tax=Tripterygium wilfordii TaxID=458696 RepID=A0A7J7CY17_TRIWF|nr:nuclear transport factor 2-like [Tripterygium wilfordii]KAF5738991.1 putative Ras-GTPase-activating protein-binding protein [Tripterygium wilfordii]
MASPYPAPAVSAVQVGSYFVGQYYQVLKKQPDLVHHFYRDQSTMTRIDGDYIESASSLLQIHTIITSLNFTAIEIKTINSLDSWNEGVLVMLSGVVKMKDYSGLRKFVQTFFLAPQEKGYFVLNDIFQFIDDQTIYQQYSVPISSENTHLNASSPHLDPPVSDYVLEEEAREFVSSVRIEDDPVDKYSLPEQQQPDFDAEIVVEEAPVEEMHASMQSVVNAVQEPVAPTAEEPVGEQPKRTYASILRVHREHATSSVASQTIINMNTPNAFDWNDVPVPPSTTRQLDSTSSWLPESGVETADDGFSQDEGEPKSVYVRNLPSDVTAEEIEQEFKNFGKIKPDGVFVRNRKDAIGVCYAFVEFEDLASIQNAIQASPIHLAGRQVYVEERRASSSGARGGRRGRGRGSYQTEALRGRFGGRLGRGSNQDVGDYSRLRGNGFPQRGSR